ncbi:hypothetical protein BXT86_00480 [candidate division WOR-3 bacterium 4484_100]|uniref:Uncharacterized protein n=1 Tax=candidate division WOR-3 bacterium 4484_100 TaxID=1936077 RepID=A0A1V4QI94_UNCW3|nr:MAG: hypothetical protein BXT86_00480 [candidate division WOR-3 bacterium 4484_100]
MRYLITILIITIPALGGRLGFMFAGGGEYQENYRSITLENSAELFYGAKFAVSTQALPNVYLEPSLLYFNNPLLKNSAGGIGVRLNIQPRLGRFFLAPSFGVEGDILFYNSVDLADQVAAGQLKEYIETSHPKLMGAGFAGLSLFLGRSVSIDCNYQYHQISPQFGIEMVWAGISYYINW